MWYSPIYKRLAESELGAGHTSGIVPTAETQKYFGEPVNEKSHLINTISIEFWHGNKSRDIKTNVNYFASDTHHHVHLTGNILPAYKFFGAEVGDIVVFWKSKKDDLFYKAELIKPGSERWKNIKTKKSFPKAGGVINLSPPGVNNKEDFNKSESEYQILSDIENDFTIKDFPSEKRKRGIFSKERLIPPRNKVKGDYVLKLMSYRCQIDTNHKTFLTPNSLPYMEKHHLIEMKFYDQFEYNIDDISNIVSLCPNCHCKIHYGNKNDVEKMVNILWKQQVKLLKKANIHIDLEQLKKNYNC